MDRHKSTIKRQRQALVRNRRNTANKSRIKTLVKRVIAADSIDKARPALEIALADLDKAARKRILPRNKAARLKSRLARLVNTRISS